MAFPNLFRVEALSQIAGPNLVPSFPLPHLGMAFQWLASLMARSLGQLDTVPLNSEGTVSKSTHEEQEDPRRPRECQTTRAATMEISRRALVLPLVPACLCASASRLRAFAGIRGHLHPLFFFQPRPASSPTLHRSGSDRASCPWPLAPRSLDPSYSSFCICFRAPRALPLWSLPAWSPGPCIDYHGRSKGLQ